MNKRFLVYVSQAFFRRALQRKTKFKCVTGGNCEVRQGRGFTCAYCRFQKCNQLGMSLTGGSLTLILRVYLLFLIRICVLEGEIRYGTIIFNTFLIWTICSSMINRKVYFRVCPTNLLLHCALSTSS